MSKPISAIKTPSDPVDLRVDQDFIDLLRENDDDAWEHLYETLLPYAMQMLSRLRVSNDAGLAEEIIQESFILLFTGLDRYDPSRGTIRSYFGRIVTNQAIDRLRLFGRRPKTTPILDQQGKLTVPLSIYPDDPNNREEMSSVLIKSMNKVLRGRELELARYDLKHGRLKALVVAEKWGSTPSAIRMMRKRYQDKLRSVDSLVEFNAFISGRKSTACHDADPRTQEESSRLKERLSDAVEYVVITRPDPSLSDPISADFTLSRDAKERIRENVRLALELDSEAKLAKS